MNLPINFDALVTVFKVIVEFGFLLFLILIYSSGIKQFALHNFQSQKFYLHDFKLSPILVGPSVILILYTTLNSVTMSDSIPTVVVFLVASVILIGSSRNRKLLEWQKVRTRSSNLIYGDIHLYLTSFLTSMLLFLQFNWISLTQGYRTNGNNDPYDYLTLGRVFEASPHAYINFHVGWYDYADRLPWLTRLISFFQSALPGGRYGDFLTFTFLSYFVLVFLTLQLLKTAKVGTFVSICSTYFIIASGTLTYILSQGFYLQTWGLSVLIGLMTLLVRRSLNPEKIGSLQFLISLLFLGLLLFLIYSPFFPFFACLTGCVLLLNTTGHPIAKVIKFKNQMMKSDFVGRLKLKPLSFFTLFLVVTYLMFFVYPPVKIMAEFFFAMGSGDYGWSRSAADYLGVGPIGIPLPQWLILSVSTLALFPGLLGKSDLTKRLRGFSAFGFLTLIGYFYFVRELGTDRYQTWKYFSFIFPLILLIALINTGITKEKNRNNHVKEVKNGYKTLAFVIAPIVTLAGGGVNLNNNPSLSVLRPSSIYSIERLEGFSEKNVALALGDIGSNMLISGVIPAKSISFLDSSYYGNLEKNKFSKIDYVLTTKELIANNLNCTQANSQDIDDWIVMLANSAVNLPCLYSLIEK